jgi:hypothetical protein
VIVSLRGTNGSGKSTIVREIMKLYQYRVQIQYPKRLKPLGYVLHPRSDSSPLFVPGHYEIANGGLDTLDSLDDAYDLILKHHLLGFHVLYEGKNMSDGATRLAKLYADEHPVAVALIDEPVKICVASVRKRGHKIKVETIEKLHKKSRRVADILQKTGLEVYRGNRAAVFKQVRRWLQT